MKTYNFPYIAIVFALVLMPLLIIGGHADAAGDTHFPLLTLLIVAEFSFFVTAIGAYIGVRRCLSVGIRPVYAAVTVLSALLSLRFMFLGVSLWPL